MVIERLISKQEILIEITTYEQVIYVIHMIANDLIQSGDEDAQQIVNIKSQIDASWMKLEKKFQTSHYFKGRVTLRFPGEARYKDPEEEVSISFCFARTVVLHNSYYWCGYSVEIELEPC